MTKDEALQIGREYTLSGLDLPAAKEAFRTLGISDKTIRKFWRNFAEFRFEVNAQQGPVHPELPSGDIPLDELLSRRKQDFARAHNAHKAREWFPIQVPSEPIALGFMGDPHVDNDGCDIDLLDRHLSVFESTPGLYGVNLGDISDNWIGRLARLYAHSHTTRKDAIRLLEWVIRRMKPLVLIRGNHDMWSDADDPIYWIKEGAGRTHDWEARFALRFPNGLERRIWARHDFKGDSQFNKNHGLDKAHIWTGAAHVYAAGHKHNADLHSIETQRGQAITLRASGYKVIDQYTTLLGHERQRRGETMTVVFSPDGPFEGFWDLEEAAEYLTWKRAKYAAKKALARS